MLSSGERIDNSKEEVDRRELVDENELPADDRADATLDLGESTVAEEKDNWTWWMTRLNSATHSADKASTSTEPSMKVTVMSWVGNENVTSSIIC